MKEIGETLDLSESRVSQMHSAILGRLKHQLDKTAEGTPGDVETSDFTDCTEYD